MMTNMVSESYSKVVFAFNHSEKPFTVLAGSSQTSTTEMLHYCRLSFRAP